MLRRTDVNLQKRDMTDAIEGDPKYLAPELLDGQFGKHADVFSLGMFILEMLTDLELPREGEGWHMLRSGNMPDSFFKGNSLLFFLNPGISFWVSAPFKTTVFSHQDLSVF